MPIAQAKAKYAEMGLVCQNAHQMLKKNAMEMPSTGTTAAAIKAHWFMIAIKIPSEKCAGMQSAALQGGYFVIPLQNLVKMCVALLRKDALPPGLVMKSAP